MNIKRKVRPNLTNYDLLELIQEELQQAERRIVRKVVFTVSCGVISIFMLLAFVVSAQGGTARDYAAEAMKKAFVAERAVHIIDEASGANILERANTVSNQKTE